MAGTAQAKDLLVLADDIPAGLDYDGPTASLIPTYGGIANLLEPLVYYAPGEVNEEGVQLLDFNKFEGRLAESWIYDPETFTWTFTLRQGVKGCNGATFNADDVVYTFARAKSVSGAAPIGWFLSNVGACWAAHLGADCGRLVLVDPPPDPAALAECLPAAALAPVWSGAHLLTAWHLAREALLYRPWFVPTAATRMPVEIGLDVELLHQRFIDTVIAGAAVPKAMRAVSEESWPALLAPLAGRVAVVTGEGMPDAAEQAALAAGASAPVTRASTHARGYADAIMAATERE